MPSPTPNLLSRLLTRSLVFGVLLYRVYLGPYMGGQCRFHPTCSQYALDALEKHGPLRGLLKTLHRLARCHPFTKGGFDPA